MALLLPLIVVEGLIAFMALGRNNKGACHDGVRNPAAIAGYNPAVFCGTTVDMAEL